MENLERNEKEKRRLQASTQMQPQRRISFVEKNIRLSKEHSPAKLKLKLDQMAAKKKEEHEERLAAFKLPSKIE